MNLTCDITDDMHTTTLQKLKDCQDSAKSTDFNVILRKVSGGGAIFPDSHIRERLQHPAHAL